jgi:hypothetical protein
MSAEATEFEAFRPSPVVARNVGGETVLVPVAKGVAAADKVFLLNKVAAFLWTHLDGHRGIMALCDLVRAEFRVSPEANVEKDVGHFLTELEQRGLARRAEGP